MEIETQMLISIDIPVREGDLLLMHENRSILLIGLHGSMDLDECLQHHTPQMLSPKLL